MKKKATARPAKATSRQSTLNFPTSSEANLVAESVAAENSMKSSAKSRSKQTADVVDDDGDAVSTSRGFDPLGNALPPSAITENQLPNGWRWVRVKEIGNVQLGRQRAPKHQNGPNMRPYLRVANVFEDRIDLSSVLTMNFTPREFETFALRANDILLNEGQSLHLVGRPALYRDELPGACFQNTLVRFRPGPDVDPKFALTIFRGYMHTGKFQKIARWTTNIAHLGAQRFAEMPFPLPPLPEQHRIVAEIEKQFTRLDAGVAALKRVQANLKRYRAAVLKAACEGKLVPTEAELADRGGTNFQSGAELLATVNDLEANDLNPRRAGRLWGAGHVPDLTDEERLSLPDGWVWAKVRELGFDPENAVQVGPMSMKSSDFTDAGTPVLNVGCVQWGRFVESKLDHLPAEKAAEFERYRIKCGDVLFTRSGTVGRCAVAQPHQDGWLMTFHLLRARANPQKCLPYFLRIVFEGAPHIRRQTREASVGSTRAGFNTNLLGNLAVPLPPLAEQTRIVAEVERRLSVVEELETVVSANLQRAARLRQSILQKAFTGGL